MTGAGYSRLWPVLIALVAFIGGAIALEQLASGVRPARVIHITAAASRGTDDDSDAEGGAGFAKTAPLDDGHAAARALARRGEVAAALAGYRAALAAHPDVVALHAELGYWLLVSGDPAAARVELERAAAADGKDPWIALNLGIARSRGGDLAQAERAYRQALALRPGFGAAQLALGTVLRRQGKLDASIEILRAAAATGGNDDRAAALVALARSQLAAKARPEAGRSIARALELAPADIELRIAAGRVYLASSKREDTLRAIELLTRTTELAPDVATAFSALARAKEKAGDRTGAETAYLRAVRIDPDYRFARRRLLRLALERQDYPQARLAADYLLASAPEEAEHHFLAGLVAAKSDRLDEARGHYRDAIARANGDYPEAYFNLAIVEKNAGQLDLAIAAYQQAIALRPSYQQAWNNLGLVFAAARRTDDAEAAFAKALALDDGYAAAWLNLGELRAATGRDPAAIEAFTRALAARPGDVDAQLGLGAAQVRTGATAQAIATYRALVARDPRAVAGWSALGAALTAAGDSVGADAAWRQALAIDPDHVPTLRARADAADRAPDPALAIAAWTEVLDRAADDVAARVHLAAARDRAGDRAGCARELAAVPAALTTAPDLAARVAELRGRCPL